MRYEFNWGSPRAQPLTIYAHTFSFSPLSFAVRSSLLRAGAWWRPGVGLLLSPLRLERRTQHMPNPQIDTDISRGSGAQRPGYRPTRVLHATVPSSSGPARKHNTAKFEPAAWSWTQMTSGSGAPKRVLSVDAIPFKR